MSKGNTMFDNMDNVEKEQVIRVKFTELGNRLDEGIRGKNINMSNSTLDTIVNNAIMKTDARGVNMSVLDNVEDSLLSFSNTNQNADIVGGWFESRYMVTVISTRQLGLSATLYTVLQGFTDNVDVLTVQLSGDVVFNMNAMININRISQFKDNSDGNGLIPFKAMNVIANRYSSTEDGSEMLSKMRPTDIHNMFDVEKGIVDTRIDYNAVVGTSNITNSGNQFMTKLIESTTKGIQAQISTRANAHDIAARTSSENGVGNINIMREYMVSSDNMNERFERANPTSISLGFINSISFNGLSAVSEIFLDDKSKDMRYIETGNHLTQDFTTSNSMESKMNAEMAEIVGDVCMNYDIESLLVTFHTVLPSAQNGYSNYVYDGSTVISDFVINNIAQHVKVARTQCAIDEIGKELYRIYGGTSFSVGIEMLGGASIQIKTSLGGQHGVATQHNYYANSLYSSVITTRSVLTDAVMVADKLSKEIENGILSTMSVEQTGMLNNNNNMVNNGMVNNNLLNNNTTINFI
jgi:hypothetical protein